MHSSPVVRRLDRAEVLARIPEFKAIAATGHDPEFDFTSHGTWFVVLVAGAIVAYSGLICYRGHWVLRNCVVSPKWRGNGFQRRLMRAQFAYLRSKGARRVSAWVDPVNCYSMNNLIRGGFLFRPDKPRFFKGVAHVGLAASLA